MMKLKLPLNPLDFTLLHDNVLIEAIDQTIVDPDTGLERFNNYEDKPEVGEVVAVGPGRILDSGARIEMSLKKGDIVSWNKYSSTKIRFDLKDYYKVKEEDIDMYKRDE